MSAYRDQLEAWINKQEIIGRKILDVGGGQKPMTQRKSGKFQADVYHVLDNDAEFKPDFFYDLNYLVTEERLKNEYDVVLCFEVMEYIWNPVKAHLNLYSFLKPGGVLYISYPTIYPLHNPPGIDYLRYSKNAIEKYLSYVSFTTWEITPRQALNGRNSLADFYSYEAMKPIRGTEDIFHIGYMVKAYK